MKKSTHFIFAITFAFSFLIPIMAVAQPASTGSPEKLISNSSKEYQRPAWSPDGSKIAFTAGRNQGIWITNADGTDMKQVTDEIAGFGFSWSMDSQNILARVSETENRRQKMGIKIYGLDGSSTQITELRDDMPALPTWANFDENVNSTPLIDDQNDDRIRKEIDFNPRSFEEGVKCLIQDVRESN